MPPTTSLYDADGEIFLSLMSTTGEAEPKHHEHRHRSLELAGRINF
jgi:hypothetical protein